MPLSARSQFPQDSHETNAKDRPLLKDRLELLARIAGLLCLAAGFGWALFVYGATETEELFRFFLFVLIPLFLLAFGVWDSDRLFAPEQAGLLLWGVFLLLATGFSSTLESRGYALFALGWAALCLSRNLTQTDSARRWLLWVLLGIGVVEGLVGIGQVVNPVASLAPGGRIATGTLYNQNHFAGLQNMLFSLGVGALFAVFFRAERLGQPFSEKIAQSWLLALACSLLGIPVLLSRSRAGTLILVLCLILAYGLVRLSQRETGGRRSTVPLLLVLALTLGLGSMLGLDALIRRFESSESHLQSRLTVYRDTIDLVLANPVTGVGPMNYEWRFRPFQTATGRVWYDYAHNDYLQIVAEWGLPLGVALWAFVIWRFFRSVSLFWVSRDPWRRGFALGCSLAIFSILLHSLVDFNLYIPINHAVFCAILGLSWGLDDSRRREGASR